MKILVFLPNWVGDVVMATPALRALRRYYANDWITYVGRFAAVQTLSGTDWANETITYSLGGRKADGWGIFHLVFALRRQRFDLAVLLPNSFRAAMVARLGAVRKVAGYDRDGRGWLLNTRLAPQRDEMGFVPVPAIDYYNALAVAVGAQSVSRKMELPVPAADNAAADALLQESGIVADRPLVMINPGASFGTSKLWDPERFAAVADQLIVRRGAQVIIHAAPSEQRIAAQVVAAMKNKPEIDFSRRNGSIGLLKALMRKCQLLITNDTGARHIAAASGIGVVTIFGSTDPDWTTIFYGRERIVRSNVMCAPCQKKVCPQPAGPHYHQCMAAISVEMVLTPAEELLDELSHGTAKIAAGGQSE